MSVREEDRRKNSCPSRGLGLAAAAIGVGVGAALYYFFSKRPENPDTEGSTTEGWSVEQPQSLNIISPSKSEYTTISEHTTTDTSIWITDADTDLCTKMQRNKKINSCKNRIRTIEKRREDDSDSSANGCNSCQSTANECSQSGNDTIATLDTSDASVYCDNSNSDFESEDEIAISSDSSEDSDSTKNESSEHSDSTENESSKNSDGDSEMDDEEQSESENSVWETYTSEFNDTSLEESNVRARHMTGTDDSDAMFSLSESESELGNEWASSFSVFQSLYNLLPIHTQSSHKRPLAKSEQTRILREQNFRERRWSLEECSICFEVMLKDQELMQLPCTHNFHVACIGPWLQEQQTCPMCRKAAE